MLPFEDRQTLERLLATESRAEVVTPEGQAIAALARYVLALERAGTQGFTVAVAGREQEPRARFTTNREPQRETWADDIELTPEQTERLGELMSKREQEPPGLSGPEQNNETTTTPQEPPPPGTWEICQACEGSGFEPDGKRCAHCVGGHREPTR